MDFLEVIEKRHSVRKYSDRPVEKELLDARNSALRELVERAREKGADAVIGIDIDYEVLGPNGGMLMVTASGTAVKLNY